jgi:hypothetical protein
MAVKEFLCVVFARIVSAHEEVGPGQDMLDDLGPMGLPEHALAKKAGVTAEKFLGGMRHAGAP